MLKMHNSFDFALRHYNECSLDESVGSKSPICYLMIAICNTLKTASRNNFQKSQTYQAGLEAFKKYAAIQSVTNTFEVQFNLGRMLAFLGDIRNASITFHNLLNSLEELVQRENQPAENIKEHFATKVQAALSLYSIYQHTNNRLLSDKVIAKYLTF